MSTQVAPSRTRLRTRIAALAVAGAVASGLGVAGFAQAASTTSITRCDTMRVGTHGDCVRQAQTLLNASGAHLKVDGSYGTETRAAVVAFQRDHHLAVDGISGPATRAALATFEVPTSLFDDRCDEAIREGSRNGCVALLQKQLNAKGARVAVDSSFGPATRATVLAFQRTHRLAVDGSVGPATKQALGNKPSSRPTPTDPPAKPGTEAQRVVQYAEDALAGKPVAASRLKDGTPVIGWQGGPIPYQWGGGHDRLGPSKGIPFPGRPEELGHLGLDCSGFTRWVTARAYGSDKIGPEGATAQYKRLQPVSDPQPGDIVFFGESPANFPHTGVYVGGGMMIHEYSFNQDLVKTRVADHSGKAFYARPKA